MKKIKKNKSNNTYDFYPLVDMDNLKSVRNQVGRTYGVIKKVLKYSSAKDIKMEDFEIINYNNGYNGEHPSIVSADDIDKVKKGDFIFYVLNIKESNTYSSQQKMFIAVMDKTKAGTLKVLTAPTYLKAKKKLDNYNRIKKHKKLGKIVSKYMVETNNYDLNDLSKILGMKIK